jgi:hypothetical protein
MNPILTMRNSSRKGSRIFVEEALVEPLDGRTLDVRDANEGLELVFR